MNATWRVTGVMVRDAETDREVETILDCGALWIACRGGGSAVIPAGQSIVAYAKNKHSQGVKIEILRDTA